MTQHPTDEAKKRAEALRWFENTFSHVVIRDDERLFYDAVVAALTAPIEKIEGLDEAIAKCDRYENSPDTLLLSREESQILLKAARLYAQGRTQGDPELEGRNGPFWKQQIEQAERKSANHARYWKQQ